MDEADKALKKELEKKGKIPEHIAEFKKEQVKLPGANRNNRSFSLDIAEIFKKKEYMFYKENEDKIIEIIEYKDEYSKKIITAFKKITNARLMNLIEKNVDCYTTVQDRYDGWRNIVKTPSEALMKYLMENDEFKKSLYTVNRLLKARMPFLTDEGLIIPDKGYNEKIQTYITNDTEELINLDLEKAKLIIKHIFSEFCFKEEIDKTMAIAALITPGCRGLYDPITARTPIFLYLANRERAGKDYLAGITGIVYEGNAISNPPISNADKGNNNNSEELRKKITAALKQGTRRLHFENNKGKINNAVLEQVTTAQTWQDRQLGSNEEVTLPNELDFSLSANIGLSWTPDFWNRCRPINLFLAQENPNDRVFKKPNLHQYIRKHRGLIQSAIITLIKEWYKAGMPEGNTFASFPEWAKVVGGIMKFANLGDPCVSLTDESIIGGDIETINFKQLFKIMYHEQTTTVNREHTIGEIIDIIRRYQDNDEGIFAGWDFAERSVKIGFGITFKKYLNREFDKITLKISKDNIRSNRITYVFCKISDKHAKMPKKFVDDKTKSDGMLGISTIPLETFHNKNVNIIGNYTNLTNIPQLMKSLDLFIQKHDDFTLDLIMKDLNISKSKAQQYADQLCEKGLFYEQTPGYYVKVK